jgi:hypothetical protein
MACCVIHCIRVFETLRIFFRWLWNLFVLFRNGNILTFFLSFFLLFWKFYFVTLFIRWWIIFWSIIFIIWVCFLIVWMKKFSILLCFCKFSFFEFRLYSPNKTFKFHDLLCVNWIDLSNFIWPFWFRLICLLFWRVIIQ